MSDKCNCFEENLERVKNHLAKKSAIPKGAIDIKLQWKDRIYTLSDSDVSPVNPRVEFEFRAPKKAGGHAKNLRKEDISIYANYCCYCGRKYIKSQG